MSRYHSYINSAAAILSAYKREEPFPLFIKKYFTQHKKFGSNDRKQVSHLCYCYFRLGKALSDITIEEKIIIALFICSGEPNKILAEAKPEWNKNVLLSFEEKIRLIDHIFSLDDIFPWQDELSEAINKNEFVLSHFQQPDLFLRLRPGKEEIVKRKLDTAGIKFYSLSDACISLSNSSKIDTIISIDKEAVIQDYNSQLVGEFLYYLSPFTKNPLPSLWDCCAASGGKSIMAKDILGNIDLTVTDVRESILINLKKRFQQAGITNYQSAVIDLAKNNVQHPVLNNSYSIIVADVPCSGSGTWGRTPEQLFNFDEKKIEEYALLQKKIISNVIPRLADEGYLLYITCSVFKKENEKAADFIKKQFHLELVKMELLKGYDKKADTMFAALFKK